MIINKITIGYVVQAFTTESPYPVNMRLITIRDQDLTREYDLHFVIPPAMETEEAVRVVDAAVEKVKEIEDYTFEDLEKVLSPLGFVAPLYITANCYW
jgi:hypothetical protein